MLSPGMTKDFRKRVLQLNDFSKEAGSHAIHHSKVGGCYSACMADAWRLCYSVI